VRIRREAGAAGLDAGPGMFLPRRGAGYVRARSLLETLRVIVKGFRHCRDSRQFDAVADAQLPGITITRQLQRETTRD
jgi:hypothetical protein